MRNIQDWLYHALLATSLVKPMMTSKWGWPMAETVHFLGLSLLIGAIGTFDLRLLGIGKRIPVAALHKLVPWGVSGYILTFITGMLFLATEPDQYLYNPAFHWKIIFMLTAGVNVAIFYLRVFRRAKLAEEVPLSAKLIAALSLFLWTGVIVFGRMLTFFRPGLCESAVVEFLSTCIPH